MPNFARLDQLTRQTLRKAFSPPLQKFLNEKKLARLGGSGLVPPPPPPRRGPGDEPSDPAGNLIAKHVTAVFQENPQHQARYRKSTNDQGQTVHTVDTTHNNPALRTEAHGFIEQTLRDAFNKHGDIKTLSDFGWKPSGNWGQHYQITHDRD